MTVMRQVLPILNSKLFTWSRESKSYVAEASDLGLRAGFQFGRVYDDSIDEGFTMQSQFDPSDHVVCVVTDIDTKEGDVRFWVLKPVRNTDRLDWKVIIFND
jgi:hypothetical protein